MLVEKKCQSSSKNDRLKNIKSFRSNTIPGKPLQQLGRMFAGDSCCVKNLLKGNVIDGIMVMLYKFRFISTIVFLLSTYLFYLIIT